jgi:hypothetical protein
MTHSSIAIQGYHHQEHTLSSTQGEGYDELGHTPSIADGPVKSRKINQQLGHSAGGVAEVQEGEVAEEEVHGRVQAHMKSGENNDGGVAKQS